jgi:hypothetical protein
VLGLKARLPGKAPILLVLELGRTLAIGEPLAGEPEAPGNPLEPLFMAMPATTTMATMTRAPTRNSAGFGPERVALVAGGATGTPQAGDAGAPYGGGGATGIGGGTGAAVGYWYGLGAWAWIGVETEVATIVGRVVPHEAQNFCPATLIAVPQLAQKPNPVAI